MNLYETAAAARYLAGCGYRIFPLPPQEKAANLANWQNIASSDVAQVESWWPAGSQNNIGVLGGDGKLILDIDVGKGGFETLAALEAKHGVLPTTLTVTTPSGGQHRYFNAPDVPNSAGRLGAGLDIKSKGGYVVGPWSYTIERVVDGKKKQSTGYYAFVKPDQPSADAPAWLIELAGADQVKTGPSRPPSVTITESQLADLRGALDHLATVQDVAGNDLWSRIGLALLSLGDQGRELWCEWSERAPGYTPGAPEDWWTTHGSTRPKTDFKNIYAVAHDYGWTNPNPAGDPRALLAAAGDYTLPAHVQPAVPMVAGASVPTPPSFAPAMPGHPDVPMDAARSLINAFYFVSGLREIHHWQSVFMVYENGIYAESSEDALRSLSWKFFERAGVQALKSRQVNEIIKALEGVTYLPEKTPVPCWLDNPKVELPDLLICQNGAFDLTMGTRYDLTPRLFATIRLPVDYAPDAPPPAAWIQFLASLWPNDQESIDTLQELFGLMLTPITKFQKIFLMVGPRRSGKGTILRTLRRLLGNDNVAGPALSTLAHQYGMQGLIGKLAALIGDARINARSSEMAIVVERLLSISGEDSPNVERKFLPDWTGRLPTRIVMSSNELPHLDDPSGAMASRFVILVLQESFYGREDLELEAKLAPEMPAILNWAIEGRRRLLERGRFIQPASGASAVEQMAELSSSVAKFVREACLVGPGHQVLKDDLYRAWQTWCSRNGEKPTHAGLFGRDLHAAFSSVKETRPRDPATGKQLPMYAGIALAEPLQAAPAPNPNTHIKALLAAAGGYTLPAHVQPAPVHT